ncbi:phosphotransferase family protein [Paenibacillus sp. GCM10027626]|uniref:phosphotransferase family protein n=1 Tax=Paenibacillus sp. GCM10027626 TaxID=3273411 RepID=UPI00363D6FC2
MNLHSRIYQDLTEEMIKEIVRHHFGVSSSVEAIPLKGGLFNTTYKLIFHSSNRELVLRAGPVNRHLLLPFEHDLMSAERRVYDLLTQKGIPCPKVIVCDTTKLMIDRDYMITEYLPSTPLSDPSIPEASQTKLLEETGEWIAQMHAITGNKFGRMAPDACDGSDVDWWSFLCKHVQDVSTQCAKFDVFDEQTINRVTQLFEQNSWLYRSVNRPHLIHTDLWAGNVLVQQLEGTDRHKVAAIIDADRVIWGDTDYEFASPWMMNEHFFKGYGEMRGDETTIRQLKLDTYRLHCSYTEAYIWQVQYATPEEFEQCKRRIFELLDTIEPRLQQRNNVEW